MDKATNLDRKYYLFNPYENTQDLMLILAGYEY